MSLWDDIKHAAEKAVDTVEETAEETAGEVMSLGDDVKHEIREIAGSVVRDLFPEELKKDLPNAFHNLEKTVVQEVVQKIIEPAMSELLKPLEKFVFTVGVGVLQKSYDETNKMLDKAYTKPSKLIDKAIQYANQSKTPHTTSWAKWLGEMEVKGWPKDPDIAKTPDFWQWQLEEWDGWKPFIAALDEYKRSNKFTREAIVAAFNKISFYVANAGNVSIGLYFTNAYDRAPEVINTLHKYRNGIPLTRKAIIDFVEEIGPDAVDITLTAKIDLGIVIGGSVGAWSIPQLLFDALLDEVLKEAGVPA